MNAAQAVAEAGGDQAMLRGAVFFGLFSLLLLLNGCSSIAAFPPRSADVDAELESLQSYFAPDLLVQYESATNKRAFRDEVIYGRLRAADLNFGVFQQGLFQESVKMGVATDWILLALTGAISVVGGAGTKAALGAAATGIAGAKASLDNRAFFEKTIPVLLQEMVARRKAAELKIRTGLGQDLNAYPLQLALSDIEIYYQAGTIPGALNGISVSSGARIKEAEDDIAELLVSSFTKDQAGDAIRRFWKPNGDDINPANEERIRTWLSDNQLPERSITFFMRSELYGDARAQLAKDLGLVAGGLTN